MIKISRITTRGKKEKMSKDKKKEKAKIYEFQAEMIGMVKENAQ